MSRHKHASVVSVVALLICSALLSSVPARAQGRRKTASPAVSGIVPSPTNALGFAPGTERRVADWRQISNYFARLDQASPRVLVETLGQTTLRRPLIAAYISAPENIRQLNRFKEIQRKLADPRTVSDEQERERLVREGKAVVAITCSIHSTELVASQMSMQLAYELATAEDEATREILSNTILLLIPSVNPDGSDIVAEWYRRTLGTPYEGTNPPELYHHYAGHDNNRDWFMLNLRETRLITRLFWREWFPQIVYDIHQQGPNGPRLFIPPFYDPSNPNIAPQLIREIAALGSKMAADLEAANFRGVITGTEYDTWWHGGLRTSPYYHNSIGILSEAASARLMTPVLVQEEQLAKAKARGMPSALEAATNFPSPWGGGLWSPREIMAMELVASRSLLSMAAKYRTSYLRNFYRMGSDAVSRKAAPDEPLAYLLPAGQSEDEALARLIEVLLAQGIEVHRMTNELHMKLKGHSGDFMEVPLNSYLIFPAQPQRANVRALFEPQVYPERLTPTGEAEPPYDVAGWTLPMQMGIETEAVAAIREATPAERHLRLLTDVAEVRKSLGLAQPQGEASPIPSPLKRAVRLAVYKSYLPTADEGWTRWLFDTFNVPYQSLLDKEVRAGNLRERYDVIILPSQSAKEIVEGNAKGSYPEEYTGGITDDGVEQLRRFTEAGGTLICFDAATELAIKRFKLPLRNVLEGVKTSEFYCPGSILRLEVNTRDALARGQREQADAYFINSSAFEATDQKSVRVVARYAARNVLRSGWLLGEAHLAGRIALAEVQFGRGRVVLFGFRPQHRGQTWGTFPFIFNAIMSGA